MKEESKSTKIYKIPTDPVECEIERCRKERKRALEEVKAAVKQLIEGLPEEISKPIPKIIILNI